jgi:hypothetical protein
MICVVTLGCKLKDQEQLMARTPPPDGELKRITSETADRLRQSLLAGQPVTTKLVVSSLTTYLRDEHVIADLARRSLTGENAFGQLVRTLIRDEAEQIAQAALAVEPEAA